MEMTPTIQVVPIRWNLLDRILLLLLQPKQTKTRAKVGAWVISVVKNSFSLSFPCRYRLSFRTFRIFRVSFCILRTFIVFASFASFHLVCSSLVFISCFRPLFSSLVLDHNSLSRFSSSGVVICDRRWHDQSTIFDEIYPWNTAVDHLPSWSSFIDTVQWFMQIHVDFDHSLSKFQFLKRSRRKPHFFQK